MSKTIITVGFLLISALCIFQESSSVPQQGSPIGGQFGQINNNGSNLSNRTDTVPGSGYAGEYYGNHSNETAPTSPSMNSGSMQNASLPTSTCDCSQISNVQEAVPSNQAPAADSSSASSSGGSRK